MDVTDIRMDLMMLPLPVLYFKLKWNLPLEYHQFPGLLLNIVFSKIENGSELSLLGGHVRCFLQVQVLPLVLQLVHVKMHVIFWLFLQHYLKLKDIGS